MSQKDRQTLKNLFRKGSLPTQNSFADIIDSSINKIDDGFSKSMDDGLMLSPIGESDRVLSVFKKITDKTPEWKVNVNELTSNTENLQQLNFVHKDSKNPLLSLSENKNVGISEAAPNYTLDVGGIVASKGRVGRATESTKVAANGEWQTILSGLNYCNVYEVVARVGVLKTGKHALLHAIAMSAYGNSHHKIKAINARFSFWRPLKIKLRWTGSTYNYGLQIKTSKNLGSDVYIKYHVTELFTDQEMGIPEHYQKIEN